MGSHPDILRYAAPDDKESEREPDGAAGLPPCASLPDEGHVRLQLDLVGQLEE